MKPHLLLLVFAGIVPAASGTGCATRAAAGGAFAGCDGSAMTGTWERPADQLAMSLVANGCAIRGTADNPAFRHTVEGTYDPEARTMIGTIRRTTVATGCVTSMRSTLVLTDPRHFTLAIVATDGACDLPTTYNEVSGFIRQCSCGAR